jgi:peptidoglycan biosynthesis protein MviN/MurJ (putative lipid II flippase)
MAASLEAGALAVLNFGTRLTSVLSAIGPEALAVTLLPVFSKMFSSDRAYFARSVRRVVSYSMVGAAVITALLMALTPQIVRIVFQHGAFQSDDAQLVASVQRLSLLQLPFTLGIALTVRAIAAAKANRVMVPITAVGMGINVLLNVMWMRSYSVAGVAAASTVGQIFTFAILAVVASRILRAMERPLC